MHCTVYSMYVFTKDYNPLSKDLSCYSGITARTVFALLSRKTETTKWGEFDIHAAALLWT